MLYLQRYPASMLQNYPQVMALQYYIGAQLMGRQDIAHLESQYSWAQIRLAAYSQGSRPSAQVPEG